ncbi:BON domain-containing protein [Streptomyces atratus]|uniref:BON domain-containing protein n=1 Tax=Streptomyces atratus TaxID=1893 RepID=UPI0033C8062D
MGAHGSTEQPAPGARHELGAMADTEIVHDVLGRTLRMAASGVTVTVTDGVVGLDDRAEERSSSPVIERLCRSVDGVVSVEQHLEYTDDDLAVVPDAARDRGHR